MTTWKKCQGEPLGEDRNCGDSVPYEEFSYEDHKFYFGTRLSYMCDIMLGEVPPGVEKAEKEPWYSTGYLRKLLIDLKNKWLPPYLAEYRFCL